MYKTDTGRALPAIFLLDVRPVAVCFLGGLQGNKLKELLRRHQDLKKVDAVIQRWHVRKARFDKKGGWYTRPWLMNERHWTKTLGVISI